MDISGCGMNNINKDIEDKTNFCINVLEDTFSIHFNGPVNKYSMEKLINELLKMEILIIKILKRINEKVNKLNEELKEEILLSNSIVQLTHNKLHIKLYITTFGGCVYNAFNVVDTIKNMEIPVYTICKGCVASAGTLISLSGKKRFITKNSYMLIHELRTGCWGKFSYIKDDFNNSNELMNCIKNYYIENTKITIKELEEQLKKDIIWNADNCLINGLVDEVI